MPELPEVETIKNNLLKLVQNKTISKVIILDNKIPSTSELDLSNLCNETIINIYRYGKYLFFEFNNYILISHLRMEGKYYFYNNDEKRSRFERIIFEFNDKTKLIYDDMRRFGTMQLYYKKDIKNSKVYKSLGKEPFDHTLESLYSLTSKYNSSIKSLLLDQHIISGIGNIYADEILYKCNISPFKKAKLLTKQEIESLLIEARNVLNEAISLGGSTIKSYHPGRNIDGKFQQKLLVYGKANSLCPKCNSKLLKSTVNGRGTTYCPNCQNVCKVIGIYGKIASGKSTLLNMFKIDKIKTFSSDEEVNNIYLNDKKFKQYCINNFGIDVIVDNKVSKERIKKLIINNDKNKKLIEQYIHPKIKDLAIKFISNNRDEKLIVLEVPLLFETKMDSLCDYIIGIDISKENQIKHLNNRHSSSINNDLLLNSSNKFDEVKNKIDFIIDNNYSLDNLKSQYLKVLETIINN